MKKLLISLAIIGVIFFIWIKFFSRDCKLPMPTDELVIGTNATFPPYTFIKDGELVGLDIDIAKEVAQRLNKKIVWKDLPFDALILELQLGRLHMVAAGMTATPMRAQRVCFTRPYIDNDPLVIVSMAQKPLKTLDELKDKEVIVNDGFTAETYMMNVEGPQLKRIPTVAEAFLSLTSGRGDAYVVALGAIKPYFNQYGMEKFVVSPIPETAENCALAISKHYPELYEQVQHALDVMEQDGTLTNLKKKWGIS